MLPFHVYFIKKNSTIISLNNIVLQGSRWVTGEWGIADAAYPAGTHLL